jgi:excisionase family DNA binding protein
MDDSLFTFPPPPEPSSRRVSYSVEEAAKMLGIGRTIMFAIIKRGDIRIVKIGRRTLVPANEIAAFLDRNAMLKGCGTLLP